MSATAFTHDEVQDLLGPLADGELPDLLAERARAHVAGCARCARAVAVQEAIRRGVAAGSVPSASPDLLLRATAALDAEEARRPGGALHQPRRWMRRTVPWSGWAVAAALALVLLSPPRAPWRAAEPPMIRSALADYRQVSQQVLPPACGGEGRPDLPIPGAPLRAPDVRLVSCWRTTLQGEAVSAWAYRWGNRVVVAYVVPEALFFRQPRVRDAVARQGWYTTSDGDASVIAWAAERSGVLVVGDAPVSELGRLRL
jgi:hypothetical protein